MKTGPAIAIFDVDGTLTRADTFLAYLKFALMRRKRRFARCTHLPFSVLQFRCGLRSRDRLKQDFVRAVLGSCSTAEIEDLTAAFVDRHAVKLLKPGARATLDWHRDRGDRLIIATASLDIYSAALAKAWGIPEFVSTKLEWESGKLTGRLSGPNLRGEAKLLAVKQIPGVPTGERSRIFAYSDDHSDLPLLRFADHGFAVDPTRKLAACALQERLQVLNWNNAPESLAGHESGWLPPDRTDPAPALQTRI